MNTGALKRRHPPLKNEARSFHQQSAFKVFAISLFCAACFSLRAVSVSSKIATDNVPREHLAFVPIRHLLTKKPDAKPQTIMKPRNQAAVTIGFAITITGCKSGSITEGAAVLKHSIHLASVRGNLGGRYDYKMYAIYHPDGRECALPLTHLGYELIERNTPVDVQDVKGDFLREKIKKNGCCGEKELVKLEAYTLTQHPIIVHLDLDTLVLKPLDLLFDWMLFGGNGTGAYDTSNLPVMWPEMEKPKQVNAFFTRDYNMANPRDKYKPVQGGFLVLRPSMEVYTEFVSIVKEGNYDENGGWGGEIGRFWGDMTFQGLIPYYYDILHVGEAVELNRCIINQMADNPKDEPTVNDITHGRCRTNQDECEDCRNRPLEDVATAHFTLCEKPWNCLPHDIDIIQQRLCKKLHHEWFRIRSNLEQSWGRSGVGSGDYKKDSFYGYCTRRGRKGYIPIEQPYGSPIVSSSN